MDSPEAQLAQAKSNLANVLHNLDVLSREEAELERLQKQHEALQLRYQGAPAQGTDPKERERLLKDVAKSVGEIQAQRSSVGRQREGWEQKRGDYEAAVRHWEAAVGGTSQKKPLPRLKTKGEVKANP